MKKSAVLSLIVLLMSIFSLAMFQVDQDALVMDQDQELSNVEQAMFHDLVRVTFQKMDGSVYKKVALEKGNSIGNSFFSNLKLPEEPGYTALGWEISEGVYLAANTIINQDLTVQAAYEEIVPKGGTYNFLDGQSGYVGITGDSDTILLNFYNSGGKFNGELASAGNRSSKLVTWQFIYTGEDSQAGDAFKGGYYYVVNSLGEYLSFSGTKVIASQSPEPVFVGKVSDYPSSPYTDETLFYIKPSANDAGTLWQHTSQAWRGFTWDKGANPKNNAGTRLHFVDVSEIQTSAPDLIVNFEVFAGDKPAPLSISYYINRDFKLPNYDGTLADHQFLGWSLTPYVSEPDKYAGENYRTNKAGTVTFYAVYDGLTEITFDPCGGSFTPKPLKQWAGVSTALPATAGFKNGYIFSGWAKSPDASEALVLPGGDYTVESGVDTLYAVWERDAYATVTYHKNDGSANDVIGTDRYEIEKTDTITLPAEAGQRDPSQYQFAGWSADPVAITPDDGYTPGAEIFRPDKNVDLYAVWQEKVTLTFDVNAENRTVTPSSVTEFPGKEVDLSTVVIDGDTAAFFGWTDGNLMYDGDEIFIMPETDVTLQGVWLHSATITFDANGGDAEAPQQLKNLAYGQVITLPEYSGTREGYKLLGWSEGNGIYDKGDGEYTGYYHPIYKPGEEYTVPAKEEVRLYAYWSKVTHSQNIEFIMRWDGIVPPEPSSYDSKHYSTTQFGSGDGYLDNPGIVWRFGLNQDQQWVVDTDVSETNIAGVSDTYTKGYYKSNAVTQAVGENNVPSVEEIRRMTAGIPSGEFDPDKQYVVWYVLKFQNDGVVKDPKFAGQQGFYQEFWHIDGVIVDRKSVPENTSVWVKYEFGNVPEKLVKEMPADYPVKLEILNGVVVPVDIVVGENLDGTAHKTYTPTAAGYAFTGWKDADTGIVYRSGDVFKDLDRDVTFIAQWRQDPMTTQVQKIWAGDDAYPGKRPEYITVVLTQSVNGKTEKTYERILSESNSWMTGISVPVFNKNGQEYTYSWAEKDVPEGYDVTSALNTDGSLTTLTNTLTFVAEPKLEIEKKVNGEDEITVSAPGEVTYSVTVTNTGNVDISGITLTDSRYTITEEPFELKAKEEDGTVDSKVITYTYSVTQGDIDDGSQIVNTVKASGIYDGEAVESNVDTATVNIEQTPDFELSKSVTNGQIAGWKLDEVVSYTIIVKNTGNVTLDNITLSDPVADDDRTWTAASLGLNESAVFERFHTVTADDVKAGQIVNTVTAGVDDLEKEASVTVQTEKIPLKIKAKSAEKSYDGDPLTEPGYISEGLLSGDEITGVSTTGSQTRVEWVHGEVGTTVNGLTGTAVIMRGGEDVTGAYEILPYVSGTLKVNPIAITITAASDTKTYDGTALVKHSLTDTSYENLAHSDSISSFKVTGSQTIKGHSDNVPSDVVITHNELGDVTDCYTITFGNGTLSVDPRPLTIKAGSDTKVYDGTPLTKDTTELSETTPLAEGDSILSRTVVGSQTQVGSSPNKVSDAVIVNESNEDVTTSYIIKYEDGVLAVTGNRNLVITAVSDTKVYDGKALVNGGYSVSGLADGDYVDEITVTGTQTNVGTAENVPSGALIRNAAGEDVTASYESIAYYSGTLVVTPKPLFITADSDVKIYDSTSLQRQSYTHTELAEGDNVSEVSVSGSRIQVGISPNVPSGGLIRNEAGEDVTGNYRISYISGTLEVKPRPVTVTADSFEKEFGQLDPVFTAQTEGTLNGDTVTYTLIREPGEEPGEYTITASGDARQGNYIVSYYPGMLTIVYHPTSYTVAKVWDDDGNRDGIRPVSLSVSLIGSDGSLRTRRLSDSNSWTATIRDLPLYANGASISYSWTEEAVDGYTGSSVTAGNVTTFTNRHEIARTSASVNKIWDDHENAGGTRPDALGVILRGNGETILGVTLNDANNWSASASNLPLNENGSLISYVWYEQTVGGGYYAVSSTTSGNNTTLVNSNLYTLTIHYLYSDGREAFADYVDRLSAGETFAVESPELTGYAVSLVSVVGIMPSHDVEFTVIYTPAGQPIVTPTPTPTPTPETPEEEVPTKEIPEPRETEPDEEHPVVVPVPTIYVDIDDLETALGLGEVSNTNSGYALE